MAKPVLKAEALRLRRGERLSLNEIVKRLGGRVSKGTLSLWLRDHPLDDEERQAKIRAGLAKSLANSDNLVRPIERVSDAFSRLPGTKTLPSSATAIAIEWFAARGYVTSIPLEQAAYDLVVESDAGLKRVQVKTTCRKDNGCWSVAICRNGYDNSARLNAGGKRRRRPYTRAEVDIFFIVTSSRDVYLVPIEVVEGQMGLVLDRKYKNFRSVA